MAKNIATANTDARAITAELAALTAAYLAAQPQPTDETTEATIALYAAQAELPKPQAAPQAVQTAEAPKAFTGGVPLTKRIVSVAPNPKKPGTASFDRYALYPQPGATLASVLKIENGPTRADFLWDIRKGFLIVE